MTSNLRDTDKEVFIKDIPRLTWGKGFDNSYVRSAQLVLNSFGEEYSYEFLMGISGAAFRLHFHPDFCPSSADSTVGFDVSTVLFSSLGYQIEIAKIDDKSFEDIRSLYQKITEQINRGIPIIAINLKVCPEWGIITGYLKNRPGILCRTYFDESDDYTLAEHAPWLTYFIGERKKKSMDKETLFSNSLRIALQLAQTEVFGTYYSGFYAYEKWMSFLEPYCLSPGKATFGKIEENLTILNTLADSRHAAYEYLLSNEDYLLPENFERIVTNYRNENLILLNAKKNILPGFGSGPEEWTGDILCGQMEALKQLLEIEKDTIKIIETELQKGD